MRSKSRKVETLVVNSSEIIIKIEGRNYVVNRLSHELFREAVQLFALGDSKAAVKVYEKSALLNHPIALNVMGQFYLEGELIPLDFVKAANCFKTAAEQQLPTAKYFFGICLLKGRGVEQNIPEAIQLFISLPKEEFSLDILMIIAGSYYDGLYGLNENHQKALEYYELAASQGHEDASKRTMKMYLYGEGCKPNFEKAVTYSEPLMKFIDDPELLNYFGFIYQKGSGSHKPDFKKALECYKLACGKNLAAAAYNLAYLYYKNKQLKNLPEAVKHFKLSADQGYTPGQYHYGFLLLEGKLVEQNDSEAVKYLSWAALNKNSDALYLLGECRSLGRGTKIDLKNAFDLYKKAEDKQPKAQLALGYCYLDGLVVEKDINIAFEYFKKAAQNPLAAAKQIYGLCLLNGIGCKPDPKKAKDYLEKAENLSKKESPMEPAIIKGYLSLGFQELKLCAEKDFERKRYSLAFGHDERALQKTENKKDLLLKIAALQEQIKDYDAALASYEKILEILPNYPEALRKKLVFLGQKNEDIAACLLIEKHSTVLLPIIKESKELWAERLYKFFLERQSKKAERLAEEKQIKTAKILARKEKRNLAIVQEKSTNSAPQISLETEVPSNDEDNFQTEVQAQIQDEQVSEISPKEEENAQPIVELPQVQEMQLSEILPKKEDNSQSIEEPSQVQEVQVSEISPKEEDNSQQIVELSQVQEVQVSVLVEPVNTVPQIPTSEESESRAIIPAKMNYPKVELSKQQRQAFLDITQRTGAKTLRLIGLAALHLILKAIFTENSGLKEPRNWNYFTPDLKENLTLIAGQFVISSNPNLFIDNGVNRYEKPINLYCGKVEDIGIFSIHQLSIDSEGNIFGPELAFQDLKGMILRYIRPPAQVEKTTLNTFLVKFSGTNFTLLKTNSSVAQIGIFAHAPTRSEVGFSENILMTSDIIQLTLSFRAYADSKTGVAAIRQELSEIAQKMISNSDLDLNSKLKTTSDGSLFRVELIYEFENLANLEKMQQLVNEICSSKLDQSNRSELR